MHSAPLWCHCHCGKVINTVKRTYFYLDFSLSLQIQDTSTVTVFTIVTVQFCTRPKQLSAPFLFHTSGQSGLTTSTPGSTPGSTTSTLGPDLGTDPAQWQEWDKWSKCSACQPGQPRSGVTSRSRTCGCTFDQVLSGLL